MRRLTMALLLLLPCGCETARDVLQYVVMPEQRTIDQYLDPDSLPSVPMPSIPPPRTVTNLRPETPDWKLSLDDAIRVALENTRVVARPDRHHRHLQRADHLRRGHHQHDHRSAAGGVRCRLSRKTTCGGFTNTPNGQPNITLASITTGIAPIPPTILISARPMPIKTTLGMTKNNVLGGQLGLSYGENFQRFYNFNSSINPFAASGYPLNPEQTSTIQLSYTQPFLQGAGFQVNMAPIVIARLNTQVSFFQYKDSVQELVRSVAEAYWTLVQNRTNAWARKIQVDQSKEAFEREAARLKIGLGDQEQRGAGESRRICNFKANLVAADAAVLASEGTLRNLLGLPPDDDRRIVPISMPTGQR